MTTLFVTLFPVVLSGCATAPVPNIEFWGDKGNLGAVGDWTEWTKPLPPAEHLTKSEWDKRRFGMACTEVENITALIGLVKKLCFDTGRCTYSEFQKFKVGVFRMYRKLGFDVAKAEAQLNLY